MYKFASVARFTIVNILYDVMQIIALAFGKGKPTVTDGPFIEAKEVLGGYWLVEANSKEELVKWAQRCPAGRVAEPGSLGRAR